jgi:hypothetical protein
MKRTLTLLALITTFSGLQAMASDKSCLMSLEEQRTMIMTEGTRALNDEPTSECFERLVASEMQTLKKSAAKSALDRKAVIRDMQESAVKGEIFDSSNPQY